MSWLKCNVYEYRRRCELSGFGRRRKKKKDTETSRINIIIGLHYADDNNYSTIKL